MDFETRQKLAAQEVNSVLAKYSVALQPFLDATINGITPRVRLVDVVTKEEETNETTETKPVKASKAKKGKK